MRRDEWLVVGAFIGVLIFGVELGVILARLLSL